MPGRLFLGLMSGTSVDGVDAALVRIGDGIVNLEASAWTPMPPPLREAVLALCSPGDDEIDRLGELDNALGELFADAALQLLKAAGVTPRDITAIGSHGQTLRHRPEARRPFTLQAGNAHLIAERTGITTIADFRRRDIAAGGHGAPLVPAFHAALFTHPERNTTVLNIGGMANVTLLPAGQPGQARGFDTGPGNVLLDAWYREHHDDHLYDRDGAWARSGTVHGGLLQQLLREPWLDSRPPRSTGRELFSLPWLCAQLQQHEAVEPADVQATLSTFTARTVADALHRWGLPGTGRLLVCGGGVHNAHLLAVLRTLLPAQEVLSTSALGVDPDQVEAMAFAWLAARTLDGLAGNLPAVTGARRPVILGCVHPGS